MLQLLRISAISTALAFVTSAGAWSQPKSYIDLLDRYGMERVGTLQPDIVSLSSAGNNCSRLRHSSPFIAEGLAEQLETTFCTLREAMAEALVAPDEVVEGRALVRSAADAQELAALLAARPPIAGLVWDIRLVDELPIDNQAVRLSMQLVALSPNSDAALRALNR